MGRRCPAGYLPGMPGVVGCAGHPPGRGRVSFLSSFPPRQPLTTNIEEVKTMSDFVMEDRRLVATLTPMISRRWRARLADARTIGNFDAVGDAFKRVVREVPSNGR